MSLQFLSHFIVVALCLLNLLGHGLLFGFVLLDEVVRLLDLVVDHGDSVGEGGFHFLAGLVDEHSSDLLVDLGV